MRIIIAIIMLFVLAFAKAQSQTATCYFITAKSGLKLRMQPDVNAEVIEVLPYGSKVLTTETLFLKPDSLNDGNKMISGNWIKVKTLFHNYNDSYSKEGYVYDAFVGKHLKAIPSTSLHNFTSFITYTSGNSKTVEGVASRRDLYRLGKNCSVSYENNPAAKSVLGNVIRFSKINYADYKNRILPNPYELDRSFKPLRFPVEDSMKTKEGYTKYYLPINKGKDSTLVSDNVGEWSSVTEYLGYMKKLDSYFITGFAEDQEVIKVDQKTGARSYFAAGNINISPQGTYLLSVYNAIFDEVTILSLRPLNKVDYGFEVHFTSWFPIGKIEWISDRQFIITVSPMDARNSIKPEVIIYLLGSIEI